MHLNYYSLHLLCMPVDTHCRYHDSKKMHSLMTAGNGFLEHGMRKEAICNENQSELHGLEICRVILMDF